jgi:hypothetical protein
MNAMVNDAAQFQRNVTRNNKIEMKKKSKCMKMQCNNAIGTTEMES